MYWIDDAINDIFTIQSAKGDGSEHSTVLRRSNQKPRNLIVDEKYIYWVDYQNNCIWRYAKNQTEQIEKILSIDTHYLRNLIIKHNDIDEIHKNLCKKVAELFINDKVNLNNTSIQIECNDYCQNNGICQTTLSNHIICTCTEGYTGTRCEIEMCENYCINNGKCTIKNNRPSCQCPLEYNGVKCENFQNITSCTNYCLNNGKCVLKNIDDTPQCICSDMYKGQRCEIDKCLGFCYNGGECIYSQGNPFCKCSNDYEGIFCEKIKLGTQCVQYNEFVKLSNSPNMETDIKNNNSNKSMYIFIVFTIIGHILLLTIFVYARQLYSPFRPNVFKFNVFKRNKSQSVDQLAKLDGCEMNFDVNASYSNSIANHL